MVVSHSNNFIFLRVPKNASSSLAEYFVRNFCDFNDQYTAVNDCAINNYNVPAALIAKYRHQSRFIHLTLQELIDNDIVTEEKARNMKKIIVMRDPLHRQLSLYFFLCKMKRSKPNVLHFREVFKGGKHESDTNNAILQLDYVKICGQLRGDIEIWPYHDLDYQIENFSKDHDIKHRIKNHKSNVRPNQQIQDLVSEYYDDATIRAVREYYREDVEALELLS